MSTLCFRSKTMRFFPAQDTRLADQNIAAKGKIIQQIGAEIGRKIGAEIVVKWDFICGAERICFEFF